MASGKGDTKNHLQNLIERFPGTAAAKEGIWTARNALLAQLIRLAASRTFCTEAWRRLAHLYGPLVYRWSWRKGSPSQDCEKRQSRCSSRLGLLADNWATIEQFRRAPVTG
jgi:hypothetical protein